MRRSDDPLKPIPLEVSPRVITVWMDIQYMERHREKIVAQTGSARFERLLEALKVYAASKPEPK